MAVTVWCTVSAWGAWNDSSNSSRRLSSAPHPARATQSVVDHAFAAPPGRSPTFSSGPSVVLIATACASRADAGRPRTWYAVAPAAGTSALVHRSSAWAPSSCSGSQSPHTPSWRRRTAAWEVACPCSWLWPCAPGASCRTPTKSIGKPGSTGPACTGLRSASVLGAMTATDGWIQTSIEASRPTTAA
ncbi:hypothetical protein [Ornithinimicrobium kibberense]|uniref:hypothetical protein n=1 Tax=Ornithinimicrobium kibberense TaxID=282060 RepID=UPI00361AD185